ncbi:ras-related protein Rab-13 [Gracilaria domingensis]|nr:ras-related protein Rab-13 [Gracilaria domingensis]
MPAQASVEYHYLYKLLLIGDSGVGKSCILTRFADSIYEDSQTSTIGVDFKIRTIGIDGKRVKLQIWDSAGQERFRTIAAAYYRGAHGVGIVFDITDEKSFQSVENSWIEEIENNTISPVRTLLIGNKCDLENEREVNRDEAEALAKKYSMSYIETSAKTAENVFEAFVTISKEIYASK